MPEFGLTYLPPLRSCSLYLRVQEQEKRGARLGQFSFKIPESCFCSLKSCLLYSVRVLKPGCKDVALFSWRTVRMPFWSTNNVCLSGHLYTPSKTPSVYACLLWALLSRVHWQLSWLAHMLATSERWKLFGDMHVTHDSSVKSLHGRTSMSSAPTCIQ